MSESFHLFERIGVELEYMIVDRETLNVAPLTDRVLHAVAGAYESEVEQGELSWSNELVLHVIELKTNGPAASLDGLTEAFQNDVWRINKLLEPMNARLMPAAMHPWMDPFSETRMWPHEYNAVYEAFDKIFNCKGHGWSNLQSTHVNLPFFGDEEFARLHAAIRLVLPILPALAASSPILDSHVSPLADARLDVYRNNARRVPLVAGRVIPEPVYSRSDYESQILERIYADLAPFDPEGVLRYEWVNARGAIARFDRDTIEIRVLDVQECPAADVAMLRLIVESLKALACGRWSDPEKQMAWSVDALEPVLSATIREGENAIIKDAAFLAMFGMTDVARATARELWIHLFESLFSDGERAGSALAPLKVMLQGGTLSNRIRRAVGPDPDRARLVRVYRSLCDCLAEGRMFHG